MTNNDEFGRDPSVQRTRKLFSQMEHMDNALVKSLNVSPFDSRLRAVREERQRLYEKAFSRAMVRRLTMDEETVLELFIHCQKIAANQNGFGHPLEFSENPKIVKLIQEATE